MKSRPQKRKSYSLHLPDFVWLPGGIAGNVCGLVATGEVDDFDPLGARATVVSAEPEGA